MFKEGCKRLDRKRFVYGYSYVFEVLVNGKFLSQVSKNTVHKIQKNPQNPSNLSHHFSSSLLFV